MSRSTLPTASRRTVRPVPLLSLLLVPSHVDPTFNLHDGLVVYRDGIVQDIWEISARGFSR